MADNISGTKKTCPLLCPIFYATDSSATHWPKTLVAGLLVLLKDNQHKKNTSKLHTQNKHSLALPEEKRQSF